MQIELTGEWTQLDYTTGQIQNLSSATAIEVSEETENGSGQVVFPKESMSFDGPTLFARSLTGQKVKAVVSPFVDAGVGGSGGSGGGGGGATPYVLPTASATIKGGVKIGSGLSIDPSGVLSVPSPTPYTLPAASKTGLGGIKVGSNLSVTADGTLSASAAPYTLPTASSTEKGGVKVGEGLKMAGEILQADSGTAAGKLVKLDSNGKIDSALLPSIATGDTFVVATQAAMVALSAKTGDICVRTDESKSYILQKTPASNLSNWIFLQSPTAAVQSVNGKTGAVTITLPTKVSELTNDAGYIATVPAASASTSGTVKVGAGLSIDSDGVLKADVTSVPSASATTRGIIKVGDGLEMAADGETLNAKPYTLHKASADALGGIKVGTNLTIDADGVLSANAGSYTLPTATATELGGVKVGSNLEIDTNGFLTAKNQTAGLATVAKTGNYSDLANKYTLPTATASIKGGVKIGAGLTVTNEVASVNAATATTAGIAKLYTATGTNTDGAMTQKAVKDNYLSLGGGAMTGAIESKNVVLQNTTSNYMRIQQSADLKQGAVLDFYGRDDTNGGRVVIACGTPDGTAYKSLVVHGNGNLTFDNKNVAVGDFLSLSGGKMSGDIAKDVNTKVLTLSGSVDGGHGARLDLVGEDYTVDANVQGCFGLHSIKAGKDHALIGYPDGRLTWDGNAIALGAIKRLTASEVTSYAGASSQNSDDTWVRAVFEAMPSGATWLAYNTNGEEWSYIFSKSPTGVYGNIFRTSHTGRIQVKGVSNGGNYSRWKECTMTELAY